MGKIVYIIPGHTEFIRYKRYKKILPLFTSKGFEVVPVEIKWKKHVMTDYVSQFLKEYKPKKGSYIFGFSFGSMIALISAKKVRPKAIILCSLSPYFKEDIPEMKRIFGKKLDKYFSKKDFEDLEKCSFRKVVKGVKCKTILIVGDREIVVRKKTYSSVLDRSNEAKRLLRGSRLI